MGESNQIAAKIYSKYYKELVELMNKHYQIASHNVYNPDLQELAVRIRKSALLCDVWKRVAAYNTTSKYYQGDR